MSALLQDLRFILRQLRRSPGFTTAAVLTLGLGIGASTAMFTVVNGVLIEPLPYEDAQDLVLIRHYNRPVDVARDAIGIETYREVASGVSGLSRVAGVATFAYSVTIETEAGPARLAAHFASASLLEVLGVRPERGRWFLPVEDVVGGAPVAVVSHALWLEQFGGASEALGRSILVDGRPAVIVGVMPPDFDLLIESDLWLPLEQSPFTPRPQVRWIAAVGRLEGGVGLDRAEAEVALVMNRLAQESPETNTGLEADVLPLREELVGSVRGALLALLAGVGVVLLIACANVANLLLTRALGRDGEMAVRGALGARFPQLGRLLIAEGVALAVAGGLIGVLGAAWVLDGVRAAGSLGLPRLEAIGIDARVLAFLVAVVGATGILAAMGPLLHTRGSGTYALLRSGAGGKGGGASRKLQGGLVASQVALATILLVASSLLVRSFTTLLRTDPGFVPGGVLTFQVGLPADRYPSNEERLLFVDRLLEQVRAIPGAEQAGGTTRLPLLGGSLTTALDVEAHPVPVGERPEVELRRITAGYLPAMGMSLVDGRDFSAAELGGGQPALLVNETAAAGLWPEGGSAMGRRVRFSSSDPGPDDPWYTVVGVVRDIRHFGLGQEPRPEAYFTFADSPPSSPVIAIRTTVPPGTLTSAVRDAVREMDPGIATWELATMEERVEGSLARRRAGLWIVGGFGLLALGLSVIGVYGVVSHTVGARRREIGIRLALGARSGQVAAWVLRSGFVPVGVGLAIGLAAAVAGGDVLSVFLYGVGPRDPAILAFVAIVLATAGAAGILVPARRAVTVDPIRALRSE